MTVAVPSPEPAEPDEAADPAPPVEPPEGAGPTPAAEPAAPAQRADPTEPADHTAPTDPAERADPTDHTAPTEPADHARPTAPAAPAKPVGRTPDGALPVGPRHAAPRRRWRPSATWWRPRASWWYVLGTAVTLGAAGVSVTFLPSLPTYDAWSWLQWGRELAHGTLITTGAASSIKPLPMLVDAVLWLLFGHGAPAAWVAVARFGALLSLFFAYRLASRLAGPGVGPVAGVLAAAGLATSYEFANYLFVRGMSEPLEVGLCLAAADAWLRGRRWLTLVVLTLAALARIEVSAFIIVYGVWCLIRMDRRWVTAAATVGALLIVVAAWFGLELWGSGDLLRSATSATMESQGGPLLTTHPGLATLREAVDDVLVPVTLGFLAGLVISVVVAVRRRRIPPALWLAAGAVLWIAGEAAMAQLRLATGAPRYLLPGIGAGAVVAGAAWVAVARAGWRHGRFLVARPAVPLAVAAILVVTTLSAGSLSWHKHVRTPTVVTAKEVVFTWKSNLRASRTAVELTHDAAAAVRLAGGRQHILDCGPVSTQPLNVPGLAWALDVPPGQVTDVLQPTGTYFQAGTWFAVPARLRGTYHQVAVTPGLPNRQWRVVSSCPLGNPSGK